ncbi:MAG: NTP transferase domain-containing protein, partial [Armatimonadetes bacterium]|nr:NTP transferase domain-containing protein [Armatimonadota bacterium]
MLDTAVILCAGRGTRLYPVTLDRPKAAINVAGKPVVARIAEDLVSAGIRRAVVVVSPTDNTTAGLLKARGPRNLEVTAVVQDEPLGLAHAVQCARKSVGDSSFLLYLGDELIYPGTSTFLDAAARAGGDGAILLKAVDEPEHFGVAILNGHRVVRLQEKPKPAPSNLAVVGLYILPP